MAKIAYTTNGGVKSWICTFNNGTALRFSEHIGDAAEFADDAAVLTFLSGKFGGTIVNGQVVTQTAGPVHYGLRQH